MDMDVQCVWEHNGGDTLLYAENFAGAFTRGEGKEIALAKMQDEIRAYLRWRDGTPCELPMLRVSVRQVWESHLDICDADSDVIFDTEKAPLTLAEYEALKALAMKSARDFRTLYEAVPDKHQSVLTPKNTFLGPRPRTAHEMYTHTRDVNSYYFGEIGVEADHEGTIDACRQRGFTLLEAQENYLQNAVISGSYGEEWSLRKVLRRFIWHDRIHAKAMYRMAVRTFGAGAVPDVFRFEG